jgi:hypothetical protein
VVYFLDSLDFEALTGEQNSTFLAILQSDLLAENFELGRFVGMVGAG